MIAKNKVVNLSYLLKNDQGVELDKADSNEPLSYLHGGGQLIPGLENALEGLKVGDKKEITVSPAEGYGEIIPGLKMKVERSRFPKDQQIEPGMQFMAEISEGKQHAFTVTGVEDDHVQIDGNHPLAGQTLHFSIEVVGIRDATAEELSHGHAHGPGDTHAH